jgi:hypothetical protein
VVPHDERRRLFDAEARVQLQNESIKSCTTNISASTYRAQLVGVEPGE